MKHRSSGFFLVVAGCLGMAPMFASAQPSTCPNPAPDPPALTIGANLPSDVCIPAGAGGIPFRFFDDFSWKTFIAAVWPAVPGQRGAPDTSKVVGDVSAPLVFETFKSDWEVFQPNGGAPAAWNELGPQSPCPNVPTLSQGDLVLASFTKFGNLGQAGFGDLVGPLVAQNKTYTLFLAAFNKSEFDQILSKKWFLRSNLQNVSFEADAQGNNPIDIKSSWVMVKGGVPDVARYYTRKAWVYDLQSNSCSQQTVALVGLHLVTKTASRPQWIWSSFEHVDNVPGGDASPPFAFNDGSNAPMPVSNPIPFPPPLQPPMPFNVTRVTPISPETQALNTQYRAALKTSGSGVWQFYQLVTTQWPVPGNAPANSGKPGFTFPGNGAATAFANTTMETFDQKSIRTGCMNCHDFTRTQTDFLWALNINAFPPLTGTNASQPQFHTMAGQVPNAQLQALKKLLLDATKTNVQAQQKEKK